MRCFVITLISSLLFSSVPIHSHGISLRERDIGIDPNEGSKVVRISVQINGLHWESGSGGKCQYKDDSCSGGKTENMDNYGFKCNKKFFSKTEVMDAARAACPRIEKNTQRHVYPAAYSASDYEKPGPYWEWPISRNGRFWNMARRGKYRIIMTRDCAVVGAVIRNKRDHSYKQCVVARR